MWQASTRALAARAERWPLTPTARQRWWRWLRVFLRAAADAAAALSEGLADAERLIDTKSRSNI
jgi:hypothetical protein